MGIGLISISTNQKKEPVPAPGPPFDPSSADNGLTVDGVSGKIVLGNDFGDASAPAQLLNFREIQMDDGVGNSYGIFLNSVVNAVVTLLTGYSLEIAGQDGTTPSITVGGGNNINTEISLQGGTNSDADINVEVATGTTRINMAAGNDSCQWLCDGSGLIIFGVSNFGIPIQIMSFDTNLFTMQIGATQVAQNGANVQVAGTLNRRLLRSPQSGPTYDVDRDTDSDLMFFNGGLGAVVFNLPNMVGSNDRAGFIFRVTVTVAAGITIQAFGGQTIRFDSVVSSSGGTASSVTVASTVTLIWGTVSNAWVAESFTGVWDFT